MSSATAARRQACADSDVHLCPNVVAGESDRSTTLRCARCAPSATWRSLQALGEKVDGEKVRPEKHHMLEAAPARLASASGNAVHVVTGVGCINFRSPVSPQGAHQRGRSCPNVSKMGGSPFHHCPDETRQANASSQNCRAVHRQGRLRCSLGFFALPLPTRQDAERRKWKHYDTSIQEHPHIPIPWLDKIENMKKWREVEFGKVAISPLPSPSSLLPPLRNKFAVWRLVGGKGSLPPKQETCFGLGFSSSCPPPPGKARFSF